MFRILMAILAALAPAAAQSGWKLVWSDEFDAPAIDRSKWTYDIGAGGWGNAELEFYTDTPENSYIEDGKLVIKAISGDRYTSARMLTRGKYSVTYGRVEARIQVPFGQGIWPAFWMLGDDIGTVGWPKCGEIDIMEVIGKEPSTVYGTPHMPPLSGSGSVSRGGKYTLPGGARIHDAYHVFAVEWEPEEIRWYFDDVLYHTFKKSETPANATWIFNKPFHLLLNVAVGGRWPGYPDSTTQFPQYMRVDYVRVYQRAQPALAGDGAVVNGASFLPGIAPGGWVSIFGTDLAANTREWWGGDFDGELAPTALDGTEVFIDGKRAYVAYISPTQINVQAPDIGVGPVAVEVVRGGVRSNAVTAQADAFAPAFFLWEGRYAVATHANWEPASRAATPARRGEWVQLWGAGFGPVDPPIPPGRMVPRSGALRTPHTVSIGSVPAEVGASAMSASLVGLYQIPVRIPESLPPGDHAVVAEIAGRRSPDGVYLTVGP